MKRTVPSEPLDVKYAGLAMECGTLEVLLAATMQQPIMMMPLTRTLREGGVSIHQWIVHLTTRRNTQSPVSYATLRAAEIVQRATGFALTAPTQQLCHEGLERGLQLQQQLQACMTDLLSRHLRVSQVIAPARFRLPDEWVWSAHCQDPHLVFQDGSWHVVMDNTRS